MFDLQRTQQLAELFQVERQARDAAWIERFFDAVWNASIVVPDPPYFGGPDGLPYYRFNLPRPGAGFGLKNTVALAERRQRERRSVAIKAIVRRLVGDAVVIDIEIISARGFLATSPVTFPKGTMLRVGFPGGRTPHARVVWLEDQKVGCEFLSRVDLHELLTPPERYPPA